MPSHPRSAMPGRRAGLFGLMVSLLVLGACRTEVDVAVVVDEDGSGSVTVAAELDAEASAALGGPEKLALDDIRQSGWELADPEAEADGTFSVVAARGFADEAELADVLADVAGAGVFTSVSSESEEAFGRTTRSASLEVEVSGDPAQFSDATLTDVLGGLPLGRTPEELAATGVTGPGVGTLVVSVVVSGGEPDSAELDLTSGVVQQASVSSEHTEYRPMALGAAAVGALMVVAGLVVAVVAFTRSRRR